MFAFFPDYRPLQWFLIEKNQTVPKTTRLPMFSMRSLLPAMACLLLATSSTYAQRKLPSPRMLTQHGLEQAWWNQATLDPSSEKVRHLVISEDIIFVQSTGGVVTAFDAESGKKLWAIQLGRRDQPNQALVVNNEVAFVVVGTSLYAIEKRTGKSLWQIKLPGAPATSPAVDKFRVYLGMRDGSVYALNLKKINELYEKRLLPQYSHLTVVWRYKAPLGISSQPIATGASVNFASRSGSLYAVDGPDRKLRFQFETNKPISAPLAFDGKYLYMAAQDFNLYCIDGRNGAVRWQFSTGLPTFRSARVIGDDVFVMPARGGMHCLTTLSGRERWWRPKIVDLLAVTPTTVFASDLGGNVVLLSRNNGSVRGALPLRQYDFRQPNDRTDRLYLATTSGLIVCLREKGREFPIYHANPENRPIIPEFTPDEEPAVPSDTPPQPGTSNKQ